MRAVDVPTPRLAADASAIVAFAIPASCSGASNKCHFTIVDDSTSMVIASNERDSDSATDVCAAGTFETGACP
jgi:hypothetical protein